MPKLTLSPTSISLPHLILYSLPLTIFILYAYLNEPLNTHLGTLVAKVISIERKYFGTEPVIHGSAFEPDYILRVTEREFTQSCITKPRVILINGTSPGPEIRLQEENIYWIRVYNDMDLQNLTMHWHGLSMAVSPFSDGTPGASQFPIPPNHYFDYELEIEKGHAGTYFYHSHVGFQAVTAAGPLIVEDSGPHPYAYDEERIIALSDVFKKTDQEVEEGLLGNPFEWSGESYNLLVNGLGQLEGSEVGAGCQLATIKVEPDKTYRFRFIGGTALSFVSLAFEGHENMTLIEADGDYTKPVSINHLQIGSGQRFSVLFKTKPANELTQTRFYMQMETRDRPALTRSYAVLEYTLPVSKRVPRSITHIPSLPLSPPLTLSPTILGWLDYQLEALHPDPTFPTSTEVNRRITIRTHQIIGNGTIIWAQDDSPWIETFPHEPYLVSLYKNATESFPSPFRASLHQGIDPVTRTFPVDIGEVVEIIIQNTGSDVGSADVHPFHAHGAHYWDLGSGNGTYDWRVNEKLIEGKDLAKRDTTMLYKYSEKTTPGIDMGWRAWRLRVTEPGVWMIHCHILQHMVMGMQTVWVMGNETEILTVPVEHVLGYLEYGGSVNGNDTHHPRVVHFKGGDDTNDEIKNPGVLRRMLAKFFRKDI